MSPISASLTPRLMVATSVVETPKCSRFFQRLLADLAQIRAAQVDQRIALQRIELEIDLQPALVLGEPRHEILLASDAQAIGVDHDMADRAGAHRVQDREEVRMQRRLAAGDLHEVRLAFAGDQRVQHPSRSSRAA